MAISYSVIISTYNRANLLRQCLDALSNQSVPVSEYEIIIVNDGSTDNTAEAVRDCRKNHPGLNIVYKEQKNGGPSKGRNAGIALAKGDIVFFTDDDCIVPDRWIETLAEGYKKHPEVAGVGGWYENAKEILAKSWYARYMDHMFYRMFKERGISDKEINNNIFSRNPAGNTSNMSYRRDILIKVGGFDEKVGFVGLIDLELKKRVMDLGFPLLYIPYNVLHLKPLGAKEIVRKYFNRGRGFCHICKKNPELFYYYNPYSVRYPVKKHENARKKFSFRFISFTESLFQRLGWYYQTMLEK